MSIEFEFVIVSAIFFVLLGFFLCSLFIIYRQKVSLDHETLRREQAAKDARREIEKRLSENDNFGRK